MPWIFIGWARARARSILIFPGLPTAIRRPEFTSSMVTFLIRLSCWVLVLRPSTKCFFCFDGGIIYFFFFFFSGQKKKQKKKIQKHIICIYLFAPYLQRFRLIDQHDFFISILLILFLLPPRPFVRFLLFLISWHIHDFVALDGCCSSVYCNISDKQSSVMVKQHFGCRVNIESSTTMTTTTIPSVRVNKTRALEFRARFIVESSTAIQ